MGNKVAAYFQVEYTRDREPGAEVMARLKNIRVARATFWATVDEKLSGMLPGHAIVLTHGARVILRYPPAG